MIQGRNMFQSLLRGVALSALLAVSACSSTQGDEPGEPVASDDTKESEGETEKEVATETSSDTTTAETTPDPAPEPQPEQAASEPPAAAPAAVAQPVVDSKGRVVRYVSRKTTDIYASPQDTASKVGSLDRGERVMVVEENGWGRITDSMFVKLDALSVKPVPRIRQKAQWVKPTR